MTVPILQQMSFLPQPGRDRGDVTVISLLGELDVLDGPVLQACLSDIRWQWAPRFVVDLTGLAFIDCACLGVLAGYSREIRAQGGTLALAGPQGAVLRLLSVTGPLAWLEVHDTVGQAAAGRSLTFPAPGPAPGSPRQPRPGPGVLPPALTQAPR